MILSSSIYEKTYLHGFLKEFLKLFNYLASSSIQKILWMVGSPLQSYSPREKEKKGENFHKVCMGALSCDHFSLFIDIWYVDFS